MDRRELLFGVLTTAATPRKNPEQQCGNCKFYQAGQSGGKECRAMPPVAMWSDNAMNVRTGWPKPLASDWCGQWRGN